MYDTWLHVNQNGLLTIPGVLGLSAGLWVKLPLWLVEKVFDFLLLRPMASIDWLLLRMTRYREKRGDTVRGSTLMFWGKCNSPTDFSKDRIPNICEYTNNKITLIQIRSSFINEGMLICIKYSHKLMEGLFNRKRCHNI